MLKVYDFICDQCGLILKDQLCDAHEAKEIYGCPVCMDDTMKRPIMTRMVPAPHNFTTIVATYPGSKKHKAGHVHKFKNRPAEKTQVGYGGSVSADNPTNK